MPKHALQVSIHLDCTEDEAKAFASELSGILERTEDWVVGAVFVLLLNDGIDEPEDPGFDLPTIRV